MKTITRKTRNATIFIMGIICALLGPFVGWVVSGWCPGGFDLFLRNYPEKAIGYGVIGFVAGIVIGALLSTIDFINQREKEDADKNK